MKETTRFEFIEYSDHLGSQYTVVVGDRFADRLTREEALGLIAGLIYRSPVAPPWLRTIGRWKREQEQLGDFGAEWPAHLTPTAKETP